MRVSEVKGVKVYDLSSGKSVLEFLEQAQHSGAKLKKLQDYRNLLTHNGRLYKEHPNRELTEEQLFQAFKYVELKSLHSNHSLFERNRLFSRKSII